VIDPKVFNSSEHITEAERMSRRAAELGRDDAMALAMAGITLGFTVKDVRGGATLVERAMGLNPNLAWVYYCDGWLQAWLGHGDEAIKRADRAIQLSPQDPTIFQLQSALGFAHFTAGNDDEALSWAERALSDKPSHFPALLVAVASAAQLGQKTKVRGFKDRILHLHPDVNRRFLEGYIPYIKPEHIVRLNQSYVMAGFPY
jgi:tetratricopeptide (TPR) repeat protein